MANVLTMCQSDNVTLDLTMCLRILPCVQGSNYVANVLTICLRFRQCDFRSDHVSKVLIIWQMF